MPQDVFYLIFQISINPICWWRRQCHTRTGMILPQTGNTEDVVDAVFLRKLEPISNRPYLGCHLKQPNKARQQLLSTRMLPPNVLGRKQHFLHLHVLNITATFKGALTVLCFDQITLSLTKVLMHFLTKSRAEGNVVPEVIVTVLMGPSPYTERKGVVRIDSR